MATKAERDAAAKAEADKAAAEKAAADAAEAKRLEDEEKARAVSEARADAEKRAAELAEEQRAAIAAGEDGQAQADEARQVNEAAEAKASEAGAADPTAVAQGHSIVAPKDAPVDYAAQTLRRPPQRVLSPDNLSSQAFGGAPVTTLPYGSEPKSIDTGTGLPIEAKGEPAEDPHGDDDDADVDGGQSAAMRAEKNR